MLSLPLLFAAGMSLMDTADGAFMSHAYTWAFSNPVRKVYYNLTVTTLSVVVALGVGSVELLQVLGVPRLEALDFNTLGYGIVGLFVVDLGDVGGRLEGDEARGAVGAADFRRPMSFGDEGSRMRD